MPKKRIEFPRVDGLLYESMQKSDHQTNPNTLAPSYMGACARQIYWKKRLEKASNPIEQSSLLKMEMGTTIHDYVQEKLKEIGVYKSGEEEVKVNKWGIDWTYRVDGILDYKGKEYLFELKTIYANGFRSIEREPKDDHMLQLLFYMSAENIDNGVLLYLGRDNGRMIQYNIVHHGGVIYVNGNKDNHYMELFKSSIVKMQSIRADIDQGLLPDRPYELNVKKFRGELSYFFTRNNEKHKTHWRCTYCQYFKKCWGGALDKFQESEYNFIINNTMILDNGKGIVREESLLGERNENKTTRSGSN